MWRVLLLVGSLCVHSISAGVLQTQTVGSDASSASASESASNGDQKSSSSASAAANAVDERIVMPEYSILPYPLPEVPIKYPGYPTLQYCLCYTTQPNYPNYPHYPHYPHYPPVPHYPQCPLYTTFAPEEVISDPLVQPSTTSSTSTTTTQTVVEGNKHPVIIGEQPSSSSTSSTASSSSDASSNSNTHTSTVTSHTSSSADASATASTFIPFIHRCNCPAYQLPHYRYKPDPRPFILSNDEAGSVRVLK